jgi:hypothetical protein
MAEAPRETPRRGRWGCLWKAALASAAIIGVMVLIATVVDQGGDEPVRQTGVNAGTAEEYARGDVTHIEPRHVFITRLADGAFIALYDKSPKQQELRSDCRVRYDERAGLGALPQLPGFRGGFVEECEGSRAVWRADGMRASGAGYGDLDRFETRIEAGDLIVDTSRRTCTRSRGVPGVPPFDVTTCRGAP